MSEFIRYDNNLWCLLKMKSNKKYSLDDIKTILNNKSLNFRDINRYFPDMKCCSCGKCSINMQRILDYVEANLIGGISNKISHYYEYSQQPIEITNMTFE